MFITTCVFIIVHKYVHLDMKDLIELQNLFEFLFVTEITVFLFLFLLKGKKISQHYLDWITKEKVPWLFLYKAHIFFQMVQPKFYGCVLSTRNI